MTSSPAIITPAEFEAVFADLPADPAAPILVGVSGGPDSTALMHALAAWWRPGRPRPVIATVDHGIRPAARAEAEAVGVAARALGFDHHILSWMPPARASQESARIARYERLVGCAREVGANGLLTAHTRDDQAETLLMRAAAGSGLTGLGGMRPRSMRGGVWHLRPFLDLDKARLVATCRINGWAFVDDPSNRDPRYARPRWREVMPLLAVEGLDAARLQRLAARLRRADEALDAIARTVLADVSLACPHGMGLDIGRLAAHPQEIGLRVLALAVQMCRPASAESLVAPLRLDRLETCHAALAAAAAARRRESRTLAGCKLDLAPDGRLLLRPEPPRSRGRAEKNPDRVTVIAAGVPHSLGIDDRRA